MNPVRKTLLLSQALWAKYTVRLAPEALGERHGIVSSSSFNPEASPGLYDWLPLGIPWLREAA